MSRYRDLIKSISKDVYSILGNNYPEHIYRNALCHELVLRNIPHNSEVVIPIIYKGYQVGFGRADIIIENSIILELKAIASLRDKDVTQLRNYMKMSGIVEGCLINFSKNDLQIPDFTDVSFPMEPCNCNPNKLLTIS